VEDDGVGLTPEKLAQVQAGLAEETDEISADRGFGIDNVNKRTRLYYGKPYGLSIQSEYQVGTCVSLVIPARQDNGTTAQPAQ
jgi:two-component system sensor histidine kinase YesM